jgi:hypothetical protein
LSRVGQDGRLRHLPERVSLSAADIPFALGQAPAGRAGSAAEGRSEDVAGRRPAALERPVTPDGFVPSLDVRLDPTRVALGVAARP